MSPSDVSLAAKPARQPGQQEMWTELKRSESGGRGRSLAFADAQGGQEGAG